MMRPDWLLQMPGDYPLTMGSVKVYRNTLLEKSDVAVIRYTEAGLAVPAEWLAYRQQLRDITAAFSDPAEVVFPDPPDIPFPTDVISQDERLEAAELMIDLLLDTQQESA